MPTPRGGAAPATPRSSGLPSGSGEEPPVGVTTCASQVTSRWRQQGHRWRRSPAAGRPRPPGRRSARRTGPATPHRPQRAPRPGRPPGRGQQVPVELVDPVIATHPSGELRAARGGDAVLDAARDPGGQVAHLGELRGQLRRQDQGGIAAAGQFGDVAGQSTHPLKPVRVLQRGHQQPQVPRYRGLQRQQPDHVLGALDAQRVDVASPAMTCSASATSRSRTAPVACSIASPASRHKVASSRPTLPSSPCNTSRTPRR